MIENVQPMPTNPKTFAVEPLRAKLSDADDRIRLNHWMPPQNGIAPRIRIGRRWINTLWGLPIAAAALLCLIALAQSLRELPGVEAFIGQHPGIAQAAPSVDSGFPWWLQLQHFLNMFFMLFIMRAGLQILADHPRLYWGRDCTPGTDWFRFQVPVPKGRVWTAKDDCGSAGWLRCLRSSPSPTSRRCQSKIRSQHISAFRAGPAWPNGAALPCATSLIW
jgi:methionine sulfoxide reductase catalytic subunit